MTKILIVGGGAVGQVYGNFLHHGGAHVTFLLKAKYVEAARQEGFVLYNNNKGERQEFREFECFSDVSEMVKNNNNNNTEPQQPPDAEPTTTTTTTTSSGCADSSSSSSCFDQVWITVASDSLRQLDWLPRLLSCQELVQESRTAIVYFQPDLLDRQAIDAALEATTNANIQLVQGVIQFLAYQSPLPDETDRTKLQQRGVTYSFLGPSQWLVPCSLFAPRTAVTETIQRLLKQQSNSSSPGGGMHVALYRSQPTLAFHYARTAALSVPLMACLETAAHWSLHEFRRQRRIQRQTRQAMRQALQVACAYHNQSYWTLLYEPLLVLFGWGVGVSASLLRHVPMERFLKFHFTKVKTQSRLMLQHYCSEGDRLGVKTTTLARLLNDLDSLPVQE